MKQDQFLSRMLPLQPRMQMLAERLLGSADEAEDAVQEVFLTMWQRRGDLQRVVSLEGYAMHTLRNRCISALRQRRPTAGIDELADLSDDDTRAEAALVEERAAKLDRMMQRLPEVQRRAIQLHYIEQLPHDEMQRRLGMSSANVYTTLSRAMSALKAMKDGR